MGSREVTRTSGQQIASDRHDSGGVIYLLSGTLVGRDAVPDAVFYWSTREVTAFGQTFEPYLGPPQGITRTMGYEPGAQATSQQVRIPVRNLPFAHSESLVAAITDDDFRVENTTATLRVAWLKPGQDPAELTDADWTPVVLNGFLGPADEVKLDGLILPLFPRSARRNQHMLWPRMPTLDTMTGIGAIDRKAAGIMPPLVAGKPTGWIKAVPLNLGVRGFLASGYSAGTTVVKFTTITDGPETLVSGDVPDNDTVANNQGLDYGDGTGMAGLLIHHQGPVYFVSGATYDEDLQEFTVTLASGLSTDVPRGGFVQQWGAAYDPTLANPNLSLTEYNQFPSYFWMLAGNELVTTPGGAGSYPAVRFGWLFSDGEVRPADESVWPFYDSETALNSLAVAQMPGLHTLALEDFGGRSLGGEAPTNSLAEAHFAVLPRGLPLSNPIAPVYYDPLGGRAEVTQQPEFTSTQTANLINYPTGGTGADNANARDGNEATAMSLAVSEVKTLTFNDAPSPFANDDTVQSTLHVIAGGNVTFTDSTGSVTYGVVSVAGSQQFRFTLASPADFNATVRCVGGGGSGGTVAEVWWEHDLSATVQSTRTTDVAITSASTPLGPPMEYAELVYRLEAPSLFHALLPSGGFISRQDLHPSLSGTFVDIEFVSGVSARYGQSIDETDSFRYIVPYPTNVMFGLHALLNGGEGSVDNIDLDAYAAAHAKYKADNMRLAFVWTEETRPRSWTEIEQVFGINTRSFPLYGPSGHQLLYLEAPSGYEALPILQAFRLPGTPGANTFDTGAPIFERTLTTELVNQAECAWAPNYLTGQPTRVVSAQNDESVADVGIRRGDRGTFELGMHSPWEGRSTWSAGAVVSGITQFYADRQAFAATRFNFDTAWVAAGLDRGSIIRVSYPVSTWPPSYRNVVAEVETIQTSPINAERVRIRARSVSKPQKGLEPAFIWTDVFLAEGDFWGTRILQEFDTWSDYWSVK